MEVVYKLKIYVNVHVLVPTYPESESVPQFIEWVLA
jgi:hypothetical protein